MTLTDLRNLISTDETRTLELKKSTGELKDAMRTVCAFLNSSGGWLVFGVAPSALKIVGQDVSDNTRQEIARELTKIEPVVDIEVDYIPIPEKVNVFVVVIHIDKKDYHSAPYIYDGRPYYKVESTTKVMPQQMYEDRLRQRDSLRFSWEDDVNKDLTVDDLDEEMILDLIRAGVRCGRIPEGIQNKSIPEILNRLKLTSDGYIKNAGAVLFIKDTDYYPQFLLRMARFKGKDKRVFVDNRRSEGNIFKLLSDARDFLFKHLNMSGQFDGHLQRRESLSVPYEALREALLNAFAHRQYRYVGGSVSVGIYDDRVEIRNSGSLPSDLTLEQLQQPHDSHSPNPRIAQTLYFGKYLETWGRGIQLMNDVCEEYGNPKPEFSLDGGDFCVRFYYVAMNNDTIEGVVNQDDESVSAENDTIDDTINDTIDLANKRLLSIMDLMKAEPHITSFELAEKLFVAQVTIKRDIQILIEQNRIERMGSRRYGYWRVVEK